MDDKNQEVIDFLEATKKLASKGRLDFIPRRKNLMSLSKIGLLPSDIKDEILSLKVTNYYSGPSLDYSGSGEVWVFKKKVNNKDFYIKLQIDANEILKCISFHEDEY